MKSQILKHTGLTEKQFYAKYKTQKDFENSKEGKSFKKAQMGAEIDKAQFGGYYNMGQTPNFQTPNAAAGFMPKDSFSMQTPKLNLFDPQGDQSQTKMAQGIFGGAHSVADSPFSPKGSGVGAQQIIGAATGIMDAVSAFGGQKKKLKQLRQQKGVADVSLKAAESVDVDARRQQSENMAKQREAQMPVNTGEEFFPIYGVGTNPLARNGAILQDGGPVGGNPGEIQNTFDPYNIYTDSGYEPLNDSNIKQYAQGGQFSSFMDAGGTDFANKAVGSAFGNNAGYQMGSAVGGALDMIPGVGPVAGAIAKPLLGAIGGGLDQVFGSAGKIKKTQAGLDRTMMGIQNAGTTKAIQAQNQSYMKDGGWVSHDWQPQVIASFGGLDEQEVYDYAHEGMDTLRAGGHLRDYTPPSDRAMETYEDGGEIQSYGLGGELQTHWGGGAETISRNPYLPGTGETVMFRGKSHEEYSPNGETGIGVTYGGNPVEVERGEPMVELEEGGTVDPETGEVQKSGVVFGNLQIPNQYIDMLGDKNAKNKKFKNYVADLSKIEEKQNTIIDKSSKELNALDPITSFDKLKLTALQANIQGANMKLKELADKKINAASLQNAINDTAEEHGLVADDLARGKVKIDKEAQKQSAKFGGKFTQAQDGDWYANNPPAGSLDYKQQLPDWNQGELPELVIPPRRKPFGIPSGIFDVKQQMDSPTPDELIQDIKLPKKFKKDKRSTSNTNDTDWRDTAMMAANAALPYLRPSDAEGLDASQLYPEMYAMATNQVSPVQAQTFQPDLSTLYDVSFQDQLNATQADYRAAQRMMGYNPAAQANLNAQKYQSNQSVLANQFRANQEMKNKAYEENRNMLNQAKLQNLGIFDKQYERQTGALANTKATTLAALSSIADKYAKNKLENRQLGIMENMYNYRFDNKGRAINMNPLAQFNIERNEGGGKGESAPEGYEYETVLKKKKKGEAKNGSIVKSYKTI